MNSLYWLILGGLVAVVLLVLVVAVTDVLVTANRGRGGTASRRDRAGDERTETPGLLAPEEVQRFNGEAYTQPLYRRDGRWNREP